MNCSHCGAETVGGAFCTVCGQALATETPAEAPAAPARSKTVWIVLAAVVAVVIAGGAAAFILTRESPAAPILREMCRAMEAVDLTESRLEDDKTLEEELQNNLSEATTLDAEAARPFRETVDLLTTYIEHADRASELFSDYLLYSSISSTSSVAREALNDASDALDEAKETQADFEKSIAANCALWPPVS